MLLDEPNAALDLRHQERLMRTARHWATDEGRCVVAVLHDLNLAAAYADRIVMLSNGAIAADGTPHDVLTEHRIAQVYGQAVSVVAPPTRPVPLVVSRD